LLIPSNVDLPPLECCFGTSPSHAALSAVVEILRVANAGRQRTGRDRADSGNHLELATGFAGAVPGLDLRLELADLFERLNRSITQAR